MPGEFADIIVAELGEIQFESFVYTEDGVKGYIPKELYDNVSLSAVLEKYQKMVRLSYTQTEIPPQNWNAVWEASYAPIIIQDMCIIRSEFHQLDKQYPYEIIINPKMSFGTGHHETTRMMLENQLDINHQEKIVLDAGCGTGVLSIMAELRGAKKVIAFDIDDWAVTNTIENITVNDCKSIQVSKNTIKSIKLEEEVDILLANINRNVLLEEIPWYAKLLKTGGILILSGFYEHDKASLLEVAQMNSLEYKRQKINSKWMSLVLEKVN